MTTKIRATIDIDIGGTFTDCFIRYGDKSVISKSPTTGYDLSVGFIKAIENGAELLDLDLDELLEETDMIRYSTTVAMNKLIERKGPKLGFITTEGYEDMLYIGKGSQWQDGISSLDSRKIAEVSKPIPLIPRENVVGVKERIDYTGEVIRPLDEEDFKDKLQYLVDQGVMGFVVSTLWSFKNPVHEKRIKELIEEEYPEYYLGNMPVVLSSEVMPKRYEYTRSNMAILNAYLHQAMAEELSNIGDELRDLGYRNPLLMVHNTGGMAEVFRTSAVNTYNGGPVAGIIGSNQIGKLYDYPNIVVTDMGGTSFDIGLVVDGETNNYQFKPVIDRWLVDMTMLESKSIGTGGGSIAWINDVLGGRLEVGPRSAGSFPGPVAYDQGGTEPTVTDADLVLGYLNPDYFHGGNLTLNIEKAKQVIEEKIAKPLGVDVYEAAYLIKKVCDGNMANIIQKETSLQGNDPKDFVLFALGGGGPVHGAGFGFEADIPKTIVLQQSPVFCAFSSSMMDIMHIYEQSKHIILLEPGTKKFLTDYESLNSVVRNLQEKAIRDITGEGFNPEDIQYQLELDMKYGGQLNIKRAVSPSLFINSPEDVQNLWDSFTEEYSNAYSSIAVYPEGGVEIENVVLKATVPQEKFHFIQNEASGEDASHAIKGSRKAYWPELGGFVDTNIYQLEDLSSGNKIEGPALIESPHTTVVLPPNVVYTVDQYLNGLIEKKTVEGVTA
ncbi:hydantoinase/oxoprolinase family protein [Bacillus sp. 1P02SD]|uniref:hydantoinase/oxoprolinase family protein n=1 Tax=Bacillus sp. 1P02SD TaxID=3132264 RepID=UPI0039A302F2